MDLQTQSKKCHSNHEERKAPCLIKALAEKWVNYKPLIIILIFCVALSSLHNVSGSYPFMFSFMGHVFIFLSLFKFFDLKGFVDGFSTYDLVTKRFRAYGYAYPSIEFLLGLAYLANFNPFLINCMTVVVMAVSGIGVLYSILLGQKLKCACLGTVLNVPLSTVSILENFGMGAMAAYNLIISA